MRIWPARDVEDWENLHQRFRDATSAGVFTGFVSLFGSLLAAALLRSTVFAGSAPARPDMCTLNFRNGGFADAGRGADDACEWKCQHRRRGVAC